MKMPEKNDIKRVSSDTSIGFAEQIKSTESATKDTKCLSNDRLIADICGVLLFCQKHKKIAISKITTKGFWLPLIVVKSNESYKVAVNSLIELIIHSKSSQLKTSNPELIDVFRVQLPQVCNFVTRITFTSTISLQKQSQCCNHNKRYKWVSVEEVLNNIYDFWGPEPQHLVKSLIELKRNKLQEFDTKDSLKYIPREIPLNKEEEMLKSACFKEKDICKLYEQFVQHCYPSQYMSFTSFKMFMNRIGFKIEESKLRPIFSAFNLRKNSFLGFDELLLGLAAMDQATEHGGNSGQLRCGYIFRYYDLDSDGFLNHSEVCHMIRDMRTKSKSKDSNINNPSVEDFATQLIQRIGSNNTITELELVRAVGTLEFRGTSVLFRSPIATIQQFNYETISQAYRSSIALVLNQKYHRYCSECRKRTYRLSNHSIKFSKYGEVLTITNLEQKFKSLQIKEFSCDLPENNIFLLANDIVNRVTRLSLIWFDSQESDKQRTDEELELIANWFYPTQKELFEVLKILCSKAEEIFSKEERVIRVCSPCYIFGDIHGNLNDLMIFSRVLWRSSPFVNESSFLFLGDYVDRGRHGVECVAYLFAMKIMAPKRFLFLRGNHEVRQLQEQFTFYNECIVRFNKEIWQSFNNAFDRLPLAAIVDESIYCAHGGIPTTTHSIQSLKSIPTPLSDPQTQSSQAWQILWNDPISAEDFQTLTNFQRQQIEKSRGFIENIKRGTAYYYAEEALQHFLQQNHLQYVIRGHEVVQNGYRFMINAKLITIFSTSLYCGMRNEAAVLQVDRQKLRVIRVETF